MDGIRKSVQFLQSNPNYGICRGRLGRFVLKPDADQTFGNKAEFIVEALVESNEHETASKRVEQNFSRYDVTHYDVHRIEDAKRY